MKIKDFLLLSIISIATNLASDLTIKQPDTIVVPIDKHFTLTSGDNATIGSYTISILDIKDNRCPQNVNCIRAGEITLEILISESGKELSHKIVFPTREARGSTNTINFDNYTLTFLGSKSKVRHRNNFNLGNSSLNLKFILNKKVN